VLRFPARCAVSSSTFGTSISRFASAEGLLPVNRLGSGWSASTVIVASSSWKTTPGRCPSRFVGCDRIFRRIGDDERRLRLNETNGVILASEEVQRWDGRVAGSVGRDLGTARDGSGSPPSIRRLIASLTEGDPVAREALEVAVPVVTDPELWRVTAAVGKDERAAILLTLRDAVRAVAQEAKCDFCPDISRRVVLDVSYPEDSGTNGVQRSSDDLSVMVFLILCPGCAKLPPSERRRRKLDLVAKLQAERGDAALVPYRRPAHIGAAVGSGGPLPDRAGLQRCERCGRDIWLSGDELDAESAVRSYLCTDCAMALASSGGLEACVLPMGFLDAFRGCNP
jgi:hypothetical protein